MHDDDKKGDKKSCPHLQMQKLLLIAVKKKLIKMKEPGISPGSWYFGFITPRCSARTLPAR